MSASTIRIGTSGWSYPTGPGTWNGSFYPKPRPRGFDELRFYAERFDTVEVNTTFYRPPRASIARTWVERTPDRFDFAIKVYQKLTHPKMFKEREREKAPGADPAMLDGLADVTAQDIDAFKRGIDPIAECGKLGALLAQFPASFKYTPESVDYLDRVLRSFEGYPVAVELRHRSWSDAFADTIGMLNVHGAAFTQIDEPKFKTSIRQNQLPNIRGFYYMRLHGRNAAQWWRHEHRDDRYNYLYSDKELKSFAETLTAAAEIVERGARAYFNNHFSAKATVNAQTLREMVEKMRPAGTRVQSTVARKK